MGEKPRSRWRDAAWLPRISATATVVSVLGALVALGLSITTADEQRSFETRLEEEQFAALLTPGTPREQRGTRLVVHSDWARIAKRADRLFVERGRIVVPVRNAGPGIALTVGRPLVVRDCDDVQPTRLPARLLAPIGSYVIPRGEADQLAFKHRDVVPHRPPLDDVRWFSPYFQTFASNVRLGSILLLYTDSERRRLRWTCVLYGRAAELRAGAPFPARSAWAVVAQTYDEAPESFDWHD